MKKCLMIVALLCVCQVHATTSAQNAIAYAVSNIVRRLSEAATKTNHVRALASPENYALLTSTKLKDAAKKLALQKQLAEAALADADNNEADRLKWHGAYSSEKIDWENMLATFYHADGHAVTVKISIPNAQKEVQTANKKLPRPVMTNGIPAKLAAARVRRAAEKDAPIESVTVDIEANKVQRPQ